MQDEAAFFEAILAEPDQDVPRLQYADWLEERGDPRGEFIRVQVELARMPEDHPQRFPLQEREKELLAKHRRTWNGELHRLLAWTPLANRVDSRTGLIRRWDYRRGFVEVIEAEASALVRSGNTLFRLGPIRHIKLQHSGTWYRSLARCPHLLRLHTLDLSGNGIGDAGAELLADSPYPANLRVLGLRANRIGDVGGRALASSLHLANLQRLDLSFNRLGREGLQSFRGSLHLRTLALRPVTVSLLRTRPRDIPVSGLGLEGNPTF